MSGHTYNHKEFTWCKTGTKMLHKWLQGWTLTEILCNATCRSYFYFLLRFHFPGNRATVRFNLKDYRTKAEVLAAVDRLQYLGENTNTTGGLKVARLEVFGENYEERPNVERIIVLITDGVPTYDADKLNDEVAAVKRKGIRIVGLGVTNKVRVFCSFLKDKSGR